MKLKRFYLRTLFLFFGFCVNAQVEFIEESEITDSGLYFWYADGSKSYHYNPNISPRGDSFTVVNGYVFFGWYKGGMTNRNLMVSRKKIGSGNWVHVEFPHKNTLIQPGNKWGDSHRTISLAVSKIDGTIHVFYDHHNEDLNYIVSKKNIAFAPDSALNLEAFEPTREYLVTGENLRITYPKVTENDFGEIVLNYRKGSAVGGSEIVHVYNGDTWTKAKQVSKGVGLPDILEEDRNYAYGSPANGDGNIWYAFSVRWAAKKSLGILNEGVYLAKCGPSMLDPWEDLSGTKHPLPIKDFSPFLIDNPASNYDKGSSGGPGIAVTANGDIHISYNGRGTGNTYHYTYTKRAGETSFVKRTGVLSSGDGWGDRIYTSSVSTSGVITVKSTEPGSLNFRTDYTLNTGKRLANANTYVGGGYLTVICPDITDRTDKQTLYCYSFKLPSIVPKEFETKLVYPLNNQTFTLEDDIQVLATAGDPDHTISRVVFFVNDEVLFEDSTEPYTVDWNPTIKGEYNLRTVAYNTNGENISSETRKVTLVEVDKTDLSGNVYRLKNAETGMYLKSSGANVISSEYVKDDDALEWNFVKTERDERVYYNIDSQVRGILRGTGANNVNPFPYAIISTTKNPPSPDVDKIWTVHYNEADETFV